MKPVEFLGDSLDCLRSFSLDVRREFGHQISEVQHGRDPADWKPMKTVGAGACEIRVRDGFSAYRVIYVAKFADAVYVLHAFHKTSSKTEQADIDLAAKRYKEAARRTK